MAFLEMNYRSAALNMWVSVNVILPEEARNNPDATYKTLYLLHGLSDDHTGWMRRTSIERYAAEYGIAVVMPGVNRSWYTDTADGAKWFTFVTTELPQVCRGYFRGMSDKREDNLIAGLSMGGYGAIKAALSFPDRFGGCAALSGALDIADPERKISLAEWRGIFGFDLQSSTELYGTQHDIFALAKNNKAQGLPFPKLYHWCGQGDRLIGCNRNFDALLTKLEVPHVFEESEGTHTWKWWDLHIQDALKYLLG